MTLFEAKNPSLSPSVTNTSSGVSCVHRKKRKKEKCIIDSIYGGFCVKQFSPLNS